MSRSAVDYRTSSLDNYKKFCKKFPDMKYTYAEWRSVQYEYMEQFKFYLLETGEKESLPFNFGTFGIIKKKRKRTRGKNGEFINLPVDWKKTKEKGKKIYNFNFHTDGYFFGWQWFKRKNSFAMSDLWYFKPSRVTSRLLAHYIHSDKKYQLIYQEFDKRS